MRPAGFSLVEAAIAAALLSAGLLAVAGTARSSYRLAMLGTSTARAAELAGARLARLEAAGCAAVSGSRSWGRFQESWSVQRLPALRQFVLLVSFAHEGRPHHVRVEGSVLCRPELP